MCSSWGFCGIHRVLFDCLSSPVASSVYSKSFWTTGDLYEHTSLVGRAGIRVSGRTAFWDDGMGRCSMHYMCRPHHCIRWSVIQLLRVSSLGYKGKSRYSLTRAGVGSILLVHCFLKQSRPTYGRYPVRKRATHCSVVVVPGCVACSGEVGAGARSWNPGDIR